MSDINGPNDITREFEATMERGFITGDRLREIQCWWTLHKQRYPMLENLIGDRIALMERYTNDR